MPITLRCPGCGRPHDDLDESVLGTDVQCRCGLIFTAAVDGAPAQPAPEPEPAPAPTVRRKRAKKKQAASEPVAQEPAASAPETVDTQTAPVPVAPQPVPEHYEPEPTAPQPAVQVVQPAYPVQEPAAAPQQTAPAPVQQPGGYVQPPQVQPATTAPQRPAPVRARRPIQTRRKNKSGGMIVALLVFAVLGGATAVGILVALGHIDPDDYVGSSDGGDKVADSDSSDSTDTTGRDDPKENGSFNPGRNPGGTGSSVTPGAATVSMTGDPSGMSENGTDSDGGFSFTGGSEFRLLQVEPFDQSVPFMAELHEQVATGARKLLTARQALSNKLNDVVVSLATAGEIDALQQVRDLKEQLDNGADLSVLNTVSHESIVAVREEHHAMLTETQASLHLAYDAAIDKAEELLDDELASALQRERDGGFALPSNQWTVLFRSSDPHHWTLGVDGPDGMAVPRREFPKSVSSLRLRRMDTNATIVVALNSRDLVAHWERRGQKIGWRGDHLGFDSVLHLGVFRTDGPSESGESGLVTISELPGRKCTGWGFGATESFGRSSQGYAWNGERLEQTEFEIAVSQLRVDEVSPFALRAAMQGDIGEEAGPATLPDDPLLAMLESDKEEHAAAIDSARQEVLDVFAAELKTLGAGGDAQGIAEVVAARTEFTESDTVQSPSPRIKAKLAAFYLEIDRADDNLNRAYSRTVAALKRNSQFDLAQQVNRELSEGVGFEADRWFVVFRSFDPSLWNSHSRIDQRFSRPLTEAPADVRFLRMQLVRKNPSLQNTDPVICRMSVDRLTEATAQNNVGFNGKAEEHHGGIHLGMFLMDKKVNPRTSKDYKGLISIWAGENGSHLGWGFGHVLNVDRDQGYTWAGQPSRAPLEIEIAVTTKPLRESETRFLRGRNTQ